MMAMQAAETPRIVDQKVIEERYTCPICLCLYSQPQILSICGHVFCKGCVAKLPAKSCPLCRRTFYLFNLIEDSHLQEEINVVHTECQHCRRTFKVRDLETHDPQCPGKVITKPPRPLARPPRRRWMAGLVGLALVLVSLPYFLGPKISEVQPDEPQDVHESNIYSDVRSAFRQLLDQSVNTTCSFMSELVNLTLEIYEQGTHLAWSLAGSVYSITAWLVCDLSANTFYLTQKLFDLWVDTICSTSNILYQLTSQLFTFTLDLLIELNFFLLDTLNQVLAIEPSKSTDLLALALKTLKSSTFLVAENGRQLLKIIGSHSWSLVVEVISFIFACSAEIVHFLAAEVKQLATIVGTSLTQIASSVGHLVIETGSIAFKMLFLYLKMTLILVYLAFLTRILFFIFNLARKIVTGLLGLRQLFTQLLL